MGPEAAGRMAGRAWALTYSQVMRYRLLILRLAIWWVLYIGPRRPSSLAPVLRPDY